MVNRVLTLLLLVACLCLTIALARLHAHPSAQVPASMGLPVLGDESALLQRRVGNLQWDGITCEEAINRLSDIAHVNICAEWRLLEPFGIGRTLQVHLHAADATLGQALHILFTNADDKSPLPAIRVADGIVTITAPTANCRELHYLNVNPIVEQLASHTSSNAGDLSLRVNIMEQLVRAITEDIAAETWKGAGGTETIGHVAGLLVVSQTSENLRRIQEFLAALQAAAAREDFPAIVPGAGSATQPVEIVHAGRHPDSPPVATACINIEPLLAGLPASQSTPDGFARHERIEEIEKLITDTIAADTWADTGGSIGSIHEVGGILVITQTPKNLRAVRRLLRDLHGAPTP